MSKKDINFIRHVKPQIKDKERQMKQQAKNNRRPSITLRETEIPHNNSVCKEAAKMGNRERLMNFFATMDGTYLGVGCKWDSLTQMGPDRFGRLL
jgi:hypothetical protein